MSLEESEELTRSPEEHERQAASLVSEAMADIWSCRGAERASLLLRAAEIHARLATRGGLQLFSGVLGDDDDPRP